MALNLPGKSSRSSMQQRDPLAVHLEDLQVFILQWSEVHERLFARPQPERSVAALPEPPVGGDADISIELQELTDTTAESIGGHARATPPAYGFVGNSWSPDPPASPSPSIKKSAKRNGHSTISYREEELHSNAIDVQVSDGLGGDHVSGLCRANQGIQDDGNGEDFLPHGDMEKPSRASGVFMHAHEIMEAAQMLGFKAKNQTRMSRNISGLQSRLDRIMPRHGHVIQEKLATFEKSSFFEFCCFVVITINTIGLSVSTQRNANGQAEGQFLVDLELACCVFYTSELLLRLSTQQFYFFYRGPVGWNIFDLLLVVLAIQEQLAKEGGNMSYLRTTRILKVLKVLRIIRLLRFFKELRLIIGGIMASIKTLFWTVLLILIVTFMFAICFVQGMTGLPEAKGLADWSNIITGMVALFMSSTGGIDWHEAADPLLVSSAGYYVAFLFYIFVFTFVIQNTITSLFVECLFEKQNSDEAFLISDRLERRAEYSAKIQSLYAYMDTDGDGQVTFDELMSNLHDPRMLSFAESLEMELTDLKLFFNVITNGGKNPVDIETFVVSCIKLKGFAKSIDLVEITRQLKSIEPVVEAVREMSRTLESQIEHGTGLFAQRSDVAIESPRRLLEMQKSELVRTGGVERSSYLNPPTLQGLLRLPVVQRREGDFEDLTVPEDQVMVIGPHNFSL